jgi:iron complex outermembrane receptor protein
MTSARSVLLALLWLQAAAHAAEPAALGLDELLQTEVQGASRHLEPVLDAPAIVSSIGRTQADALGHVTVGDMLARLPGIYLTTSRGYSSVGLRGFNRPGDYNARMLMTIDGFRVNDAIYDQALPEYEFPIVADWVKRLELVSSPAAAMYGSNALLGVANVVTLDGADAPGLRLRTSIGEAGSHLLTGQYGWHDGDSDVFIGLAGHQLAGQTLQAAELASPTAPGGRVAGLDGTGYHSLFAKLRHGAWRLTLVDQQRDKDLATAPYGTVPGADGTRYRDRYRYAELAFEPGWLGDWRPSLRLDGSHTRFDGHYVYPGSSPGTTLVNRDLDSAESTGLSTALQWRGWINHAWTFGFDARRVLRARQLNEDLSPAWTYLDRTDRRDQWAVYLQDQIRLSERLSITLGARNDHVEGFPEEVSPRLALIYRRSENEALKLMVSRAFRAPNFAERYYDDGNVSQRANPALEPEHVTTVELGWERGLGANTRLSASLYQYRMRQLIDFVALNATLSQYQNVSDAHGEGIDLDLEHRFGGGWQWRGSLSLAQARAQHRTLTNSPHWLFKSHLFGPLSPDWEAGFELQAIGHRDGQREPVAAQGTANAVLRWRGAPLGTVALRVVNLTDARTWDPAGLDNSLQRVPRDRRSAWLDWLVAF